MIDSDDGFAGRLATHAATDPSGLFARFRGDPVTYGDLERRSNSLANWLKKEGIKKGDRIVLMIHNSPAALALLFAIAKTGAVWVPINVQARGDNLAYVLSHSAPDRLFAEHDLRLAELSQ